MKSVIRTAVVAIAALLTVTGVTTATLLHDGGGSATVADVVTECGACWD